MNLEEIVRESIRKAALTLLEEEEGVTRFGPFKKGDSVVNAGGDLGVVQKWDSQTEEFHGKALGPDELPVYWSKRPPREADAIERIEDLELAPERGSQEDRPYTAPIDPDDLHEQPHHQSLITEISKTNLKGDNEMNLEEIVRGAIRRALKEREDKPLQEAEPDRSVGHHAVIDGEFYVDSNFLNKLNKVSEMGALDHIGFGDFSFDSADGEKEMRFSRGGKDIPGQVGRSHSVYSHPPEFIEDVVAALESAGLLATAEEPPPDLEEKKYRREEFPEKEQLPVEEFPVEKEQLPVEEFPVEEEDEEEELRNGDPMFEESKKEEEEELSPAQEEEMDVDNDGDIDGDDMKILQRKKEKNETLAEAEDANLNENVSNKDWYDNQLFKSLMKKWAN